MLKSAGFLCGLPAPWKVLPSPTEVATVCGGVLLCTVNKSLKEAVADSNANGCGQQ